MHGFNITSERGAHAALAAVVQPPGVLRPDEKYAVHAGVLEPLGGDIARASLWPAADQDRMLDVCEAWAELWRVQAERRVHGH